MAINPGDGLPGGGFPALPHRTPPPGDPPIWEYKVCKMAEETLLHHSAPSVGPSDPSIAFSTGDGRAGSGRPSPRISPPGAEGGGNGRSNAVQNRGEGSSPQFCTTFWGVGRVHRHPDRRWTPGEQGSPPRFVHLTRGFDDARVGSVQNDGRHSPPSFCTVCWVVASVRRHFSRRWTRRERVPIPALFDSRRAERGAGRHQTAADTKLESGRKAVFLICLSFCLFCGHRYCVNYCGGARVQHPWRAARLRPDGNPRGRERLQVSSLAACVPEV